MKIGYPNHPRKDLAKEVEWIGKNGFDFVDLFLEEDEAVPEKIIIKKVRQALRKYKLSAVGHTAYYLPIGSPIKALREASVKETERYFKVFQKLGVKFVSIHANWCGGLFSTDEAINFQTEILRKLVKKAKRYDIKIMYELFPTKYDTIKNIAKVMNRVPGLYFHLDIGHANLFGKKPEEFIKKFHKKMKHVHMHDNKGFEDEHLAIGKGRIKWKSLIKVLKKYYNGTITLEVFSKNKNDILRSKARLKALWNRA